jgi:ABC-type glycerol-3-phosphate transport system substrate-binding protein
MKRNLALAGVTTVALAIALTGCGTGGSASQDSSSSEVSTTFSDDPVTLKVAYASVQPITPLTEGFTAKHPNVTFELIETPFADYQTSLKLAMASNDSPDIVQYSPAPMRAIVPAGLVEPLDAYAEAYGWADQVPESLLGIVTSNKDATRYGEGSLYALPGAVQMLGVFYNKAVTSAAGITTEPATLADFEKDLAAVKTSGVTPLAVPALATGGFQLWGALASELGDPAVFSSWVYGDPGATLLDDPGFEKAAATIKTWADAGYMAAGVSAVADPDAITELTSGQRGYFLTGNWNAKQLSEALGDDLGFFLLPGVEADSPAVASGSGFPYSISAKSQHKDVAAAFLDYIVSEGAAQGVYDGGFIPIQPFEGSADDVRGTVVAAYQEVVAGQGITPFANWASSSMIDPLSAGIQGVISGNVTPRAFLESLQADWESNR